MYPKTKVTNLKTVDDRYSIIFDVYPIYGHNLYTSNSTDTCRSIFKYLTPSRYIRPQKSCYHPSITSKPPLPWVCPLLIWFFCFYISFFLGCFSNSSSPTLHPSLNPLTTRVEVPSSLKVLTLTIFLNYLFHKKLDTHLSVSRDCLVFPPPYLRPTPLQYSSGCFSL